MPNFFAHPPTFRIILNSVVENNFSFQILSYLPMKSFFWRCVSQNFNRDTFVSFLLISYDPRFKDYANLWKGSSDTIKWFISIENKEKATFIKFHIIDFYSSMSRDLLVNCINFD